MYYCEKCKTLSEQPVCDNCGRGISEAKPNDICYFVTMDHFNASMFKEALEYKKIDFFSLPTGFSHNTRASSEEEIFVPFKFYDAADEVLRAVFTPTDEDESDNFSEEDEK